jgi:cholesterol transport system auxiliary component
MKRSRSRSPMRGRPIGVRVLVAALALALAGCSLLGGNKDPVTMYAPEPRVAADPSWPTVDWQLVVAQPQASRMVDSSRIAVRPTPGELQVYKGAAWAREPGEQLRDAILRTLEDSGTIAAVARQGSGIAADYRLELDVRRYEADYAGATVPAATIEVSAKLLRSIGQEVVGSRTFRGAVPAAGTDPALVAQAFGAALATVSHDIAGWTLETGSAANPEGDPGSGPHAGLKTP